MLAVIPRLLVGIALLLLGRKLFWLFVGGTGFVAGALLATLILQRQPAWVVLLVALVVGIVGAVLALFLQRLAIGFAGFLSGAYLVFTLLRALGQPRGILLWLLAFVGGLLGAILVGVLFDWALIVLSSLTGSAVVVEATGLALLPGLLLFAVLLAIGITAQFAMMRPERPATAT
jgi:hypothetical protein